MATTTKSGVKIVTGGRKGKEWTRWLILAAASAVTPRQARRSTGGSANAPLGSSTIIPDTDNPALTIQADDVSVQAGGAPRKNPTVAAGEATAPAAAALIADTGALAAGTYYLEGTIAFDGASAAGKSLKVEHRDAANTSTLAVIARGPCGGAMGFGAERIVIAANERIRVIVAAVAGAAAEVAQAQIRVYKLGA